MAWSHLTLLSLWHSWVTGSKRYLSGHLKHDYLTIVTLSNCVKCYLNTLSAVSTPGVTSRHTKKFEQLVCSLK